MDNHVSKKSKCQHSARVLLHNVTTRTQYCKHVNNIDITMSENQSNLLYVKIMGHFLHGFYGNFSCQEIHYGGRDKVLIYIAQFYFLIEK